MTSLLNKLCKPGGGEGDSQKSFLFVEIFEIIIDAYTAERNNTERPQLFFFFLSLFIWLLLVLVIACGILFCLFVFSSLWDL